MPNEPARLKTIASFLVDHQTLQKGLYLSRQDGDVLTFDLRMTRPNKDEPLSSAAIHTLEHLGATYLRNSDIADDVIYFGPMGCRTGFYLLTRDSIPFSKIKAQLIDMCGFICDFSGPIQGATPQQCGNYRDMDLPAAKTAATDYRVVLIAAGDRSWDY